MVLRWFYVLSAVFLLLGDAAPAASGPGRKERSDVEPVSEEEPQESPKESPAEDQGKAKEENTEIWQGFSLGGEDGQDLDSKETSRESVQLLFLDTLAGIGVGTDEAAQAGALLKRSLSALKHIELIDPDSMARQAEGEIPREVKEALARASDHVRKGRENLLNLSLREAIDAFQTARDLFHKQQHWLDDPEPLIGALIGLGEALATAGHIQAAREAYREVLWLSPGYEPDPGQVPSKFRTLFEKVRERAARELTGNLVVTSEPKEAAVVLDGLTQGNTPVLKGNIPAGLHSLLLRKEGFRPVRKKLKVVAGESAEVTVKLVPLIIPKLIRHTRLALTGNKPGKDAQSLARELARAAGVPAVVLSQATGVVGGEKVLTVAVVMASRAKPYLFGAKLLKDQEGEVGKVLAWQISDTIDGSGGPGKPPNNLGLSFDKRLLGEPVSRELAVAKAGPVAEMVQKAGGLKNIPLGVQPPIEKELPPDTSPMWRKWWFWAGAGAAVAAAIGTTLWLTLGRSTETVYEPGRIHVMLERVSP